MPEENKEQLNEDGTPKEPELRQDDVSNDMTRTILERNNVKTDSQEVIKKDDGEKKEDTSAPAESKDDKQESKQEQTVTLTEDDIVVLEAAGVDEESLDGKTVEEIKAIAQDAREKQGVSDDTSQGLSTVSEEDAIKAGGFAGNLIGKTPAELLEIINNQNSYIGEQNEKLSKPRESVDSLNQQNLRTEDTDLEENSEAVDLLGLTPEDQAKELARIIKVQVDAGIQKGLEQNPDLETVRNQARADRLTEFHTSLSKQLPEDITTPEQAKQVFDGWVTATKEQYTVDDLKALAKTPNILITLISDHYFKNNKVEPIVKKGKEVTKVVKKVESKSYQRMRSMIQDAPAGDSTFNFKRKAIEDNESDLTSKEGTEEQQMYGRILQRNLQR